VGGLVASFRMNTRRLDLEGCFNFRDLGGWSTDDGRTVRWGKLFRADAVHLMTAVDVARARGTIGLRTMLDLRNDGEIDAGGIGLLADAGTVRLHFPITGGSSRPVVDGVAAMPSPDRSPETLAAGYLRLLDFSSGLVVGAVDALAGGDALPAVFFCAAGKDRTGVLCATILGSLGVRDSDIVEDYVLTEESIGPIIERFASIPGSPAMYRDRPPSHFAPLHETMERVIQGVRTRYGSFADYLLSSGLSEAALDRLRAALLVT